MSNQHSIVYVMRHIDSGGHIKIPYKKIGITGSGNATISSRLQQISSTKSPIKAQCIAAWQHDDAMAVEKALHSLLEENRVEGEWFYDKDDALVERMEQIMGLLGAVVIPIEASEDTTTKNFLKEEGKTKSLSIQTLLGEISGSLTEPLRTSTRKSGPTLFSDRTNLTYYVGYRESGNHKLHIGRSKEIYDKLSSFLEEKEYTSEQERRGDILVIGLTTEKIIDLINIVESEFNASQ